MKSDKAHAPERNEYTLAVPHTHQGKDYLSGDKITLTDAQAVFVSSKLAGKTPSRAAEVAAATQEA